MAIQLTRACRRFFGVGNWVGEKTRIARCCTFLAERVCHNCEKSVKMYGLKVCDTENAECMECVKHTYKTAYGEECKCIQ